MKVFMEAQPLLGARSGIARYVECLCSNLSTDPELHISLVFNRIIKGIKESDIINFAQTTGSKIRNNMYPYKVIRRFLKPNYFYELPYDLFTTKADLYHGTNFVHTPMTKGKSVITIHDLAFMKYPDATTHNIYKHHTRWIPYSVKRCDRIIADSHHTKRDIVEFLGVDEDRIDVIHLAAESRFKYVEATDSIINKYQLPAQYLLFVGTLEPRKNLSGLLQSYSLLKRNTTTQAKLVIVGAKGWKYDPIFELIKELKLQDDVIFTGFIADEDLPAIYSKATAFVMPSIYEGFGLPLLEAMQCGVPVIGSNVSAIPEIIGEHGMLIDPFDTEAWAASMHLLITDKQKHAYYKELALQRASQFTWEKTAAQTKKVYELVLGS